MSKPFDMPNKTAINEAGPKALPTPTAPKHNASVIGDANMPVDGYYTDSTPVGNQEHSSNWKSIGELARNIARGIGGDV